MRALLERLKPHLPSETIAQPPEKFVAHYDEIIRAYVESIDKVKSIFRKF
jgi:hypothetical protein